MSAAVFLLTLACSSNLKTMYSFGFGLVVPNSVWRML